MQTKTVKALTRPELNHWHFEFITSSYFNGMTGRYFSLGFFKLLSYPEEGYIFTKKNYQGFWFRKTLYLPIISFGFNVPTKQEIINKIKSIYV